MKIVKHVKLIDMHGNTKTVAQNSQYTFAVDYDTDTLIITEISTTPKHDFIKDDYEFMEFYKEKLYE